MGICEIVCDHINFDKNKEITLNRSSTKHNRSRVLDTIKKDSFNSKENNINEVDDSKLFSTNKNNNITSKRTEVNLSSKKNTLETNYLELPKQNIKITNSNNDIIKITKIQNSYRNFNNNLYLSKSLNENSTFLGMVNKKNNKKYSFGVLKWNDGDYYKGIFINDNFNGLGKYFTQSTESIYIGYFKNNQINGFGFEKWKNGSTFTGLYNNQKKQNIGILELNKNLSYEGEFKDNNFNGYGTLYINNKEILVQGFFCNNVIDKFAIYQNIKENKIYIGEISYEFEFNGIGMLYEKNEDKVSIGLWKNNKLNGDCIIISYNNNKKEIKKYYYNNDIFEKEYNDDRNITYEKFIDLVDDVFRN